MFGNIINKWFPLKNIRCASYWVCGVPREALQADGDGVVVRAEDGGVVLQDDLVHLEVAGRLHVVTHLQGG